MASFSIHLAIAKRYIEKTKRIKNEKEFYKGIIAPDLASNKAISHYSDRQNKNNLLEYLRNKVLLNNYLEAESINSDYKKGVFLHLITDYLFFNYFFDYEYLSTVAYEIFWQDLYYSYGVTNTYIENKYEIDYMDFEDEIRKNIRNNKKKAKVSTEIGKNILPLVDLDVFIEYVSDINLEKYRDKIIENGANVLP